MKISILGTNGFLSTAIAKYANQRQWKLNIYGRREPTGHDFNTFYNVDFMKDELDYSTLVDSDIIIYAIGAGIQSNRNEGPDLVYGLNVSVPVSICNKLKEIDYRGNFITFGSYFEIGETIERHPFTEKEILKSTYPAPNDYAVSKRMFSSFVSSYKHGFTHWHFYIPTIYGAGENPNRLIPYIVKAIRNNETLHFTSGDQVRQYIHVSEIPQIIELCFRNQIPSGLYNIAGNETLSVKDIVTTIHDELGQELQQKCFGSVNRTDVGMKYLALDDNKIKKYISFCPLITIKKSINEYSR